MLAPGRGVVSSWRCLALGGWTPLYLSSADEIDGVG